MARETQHPSREGTPPQKMRHLRRHPRTGIYWFRMAVPAELRDQLGRVEIVCSLGTRSEQEACRKLPAVRADAERRIAQARRERRNALPDTLYRSTSDPPPVPLSIMGEDVGEPKSVIARTGESRADASTSWCRIAKGETEHCVEGGFLDHTAVVLPI